MGRTHDEKCFGPKMSYSSPFLLPKGHIQKKFHHYFYYFFTIHKTNVFLMKFEKIPHVTPINSKSIKSTNLLHVSRMHYSGTRQSCFYGGNSIKGYCDVTSPKIQTVHTRQMSNPQHGHFIYSNVIK